MLTKQQIEDLANVVLDFPTDSEKDRYLLASLLFDNFLSEMRQPISRLAWHRLTKTAWFLGGVRDDGEEV